MEQKQKQKQNQNQMILIILMILMRLNGYVADDRSALVQVQPELIARRVALRILESQVGSDSGASLVIQGATHQSSNYDMETSSIRRTAGISSAAGAEAGAVRRRNPQAVKNNSYTWRLRVQVPSWITSRALELAGLRAPDGWKFALRVYNTISWEAAGKTIRFAGSSNIQGLQDLFASKQVSPFDRLESGATLLFVSTLSIQPRYPVLDH